MGPCAHCERLVLAYRDFGGAPGMDTYRCIQCDGLLSYAVLHGASLDVLEEQGYGVVGNDAKKGGCAESGACSISGKKVSGPGEGGCHDGDCTKAHAPKGPLAVRRAGD